MVRVEYKRGKALMVFGFFGLCALLFAWLFVSPEDFSNIRKARWLTSGFGRWTFLPIFLLATGVCALRAGMFAVGDAMAVEMTSTHLRLNGFWGRKELRWDDVRGAELENNTGGVQLAVLTRTGGDFGNGKIRLPLGLAGLSEVQLYDLLNAIDERCRTPAPAPVAAEDFAAPVSAMAARPTFGRKQV